MKKVKINRFSKIILLGTFCLCNFIFSSLSTAQPFTKKINEDRLLVLDSLKEKYELEKYFDVFKDRNNSYAFEALNPY